MGTPGLLFLWELWVVSSFLLPQSFIVGLVLSHGFGHMIAECSIHITWQHPFASPPFLVGVTGFYVEVERRFIPLALLTLHPRVKQHRIERWTWAGILKIKKNHKLPNPQYFANSILSLDTTYTCNDWMPWLSNETIFRVGDLVPHQN